MRNKFLITISVLVVALAVFWISPTPRINGQTAKPSADQSDTAKTPSSDCISYDYSRVDIDIPLDVIMGDGAVFENWQQIFKKQYVEMVRASWPWTPALKDTQAIEGGKGYKAFKVNVPYPKDCPLSGVDSGGILAVPDMIDPSKPIVIAIHGHERPTQGKFPLDMLDEGQWARILVDNGYIVFCPVSMHHEKIKKYGQENGYPLVWTKITSDYMDCLQSEWDKFPHRGLAAVGLSSGGQIASFLMAYRDDISKGFFAGSLQPLEFLRTEYRIKDHPNCWDVPRFASYDVVYALLPPGSVCFYFGKKDPFYPNLERFPQYPWFSGTKRDVTSDEFYGSFLLLRELFSKRGGSITLLLHDGGHEISGQAAADFLSDN